MLSKFTQSSTQQYAQPPLNFSSYCQRLKKGESLNDLIDSVGSEEEEKFLCENLNVLKAYADGLSKKILIQVIGRIKNKASLSQVVNTLSPFEISLIIDHISELKILSLEISGEEETHNFMDNVSLNISASTIKGSKLETMTSTWHNNGVIESVSKNKMNLARDPPSRLVRAESPQEQPVDEFHQPKYPIIQTQNDSRFQSVPQKQFQQTQYADNVDALENTKITFGKLLGKTFKEVLDEESRHFTWFRWLKYEYMNATSDLGCAKKAVMYFRQKLPQWESIPPMPQKRLY